MRNRAPELGDASTVVELAAGVIGERRAAPLVRAHVERGELLVADDGGVLVGFIAYRTDWFQCAFVSLVVVAEPATVLVDRRDQRGLDPDAPRTRLRSGRPHRPSAARVPRAVVLQAPAAMSRARGSAQLDSPQRARRSHRLAEP